MNGPTNDPADRVVDLLAQRRARLGAGRLLCVDGPAGSGKTMLAGRVAARTGAPVVHMDDLYPGWDGLARVEPHVLGILGPLAEGRTGSYRRYDWHAGRYADLHHVAPCPLLVLEGVAAGNRAWARWCTVLVFMTADEDRRLQRGLARDGEAMRQHWLAWIREEERMHDEQGTRARADLVVPT
ncbi:MAG: uridine kinase family protein [Marmoricola sp.]